MQLEATKKKKVNGIHSWGCFCLNLSITPTLTYNRSAEREFSGRDTKLTDIGSAANFKEGKVNRGTGNSGLGEKGNIEVSTSGTKQRENHQANKTFAGIPLEEQHVLLSC